MATISPMTDETGSVVGMLGIAKDLSGRKVIEEQRKMLGRMEEREMLAMDLHDNIVQAIYGAVLGIGAVERTLALDARQTLATLHQVKTQLNATIHELRSYIFDLRRAEATRGASLSAGLQAIAEELRTYSLVHVELAVDERAEGVIGPALVDQLLAVAREATSNVIQHAAASALTLRVGLEDRRIVLDVMDDGLGFESGTAPPSAGHGLINMSQRVQRVGGQLSVESRRGQGTRLRVQVPVADRPD
jgi:signal transduction histidine kinase